MRTLVGQCGNQIGSSLWPLVLQEYGIQPTSGENDQKSKIPRVVQNSMNAFFNIPNCKRNSAPRCFSTLDEVFTSKAKARAICVDMENGVLSRMTNSYMNNIFDKKCFISNYPGSGNNWAEGYYEHGPAYEERILNTVQYAVERCDSLHGFLMIFSLGGGTGSGLGTYILKLLADHYPDVERFVTCVYPTGTEDVITCPYNMTFATQELLQNATCVFPVENQALMHILSQRKNKFQERMCMSLCNSFEDMNDIIVDMILHLTSGSRFPGSLNFDMNDINTNMIPYPDLNFISSGLSQYSHKSHTKLTKDMSQQLKDEYFWSACSKNNQLIRHNPIVNSLNVRLMHHVVGLPGVNDIQAINFVRTSTRDADAGPNSVLFGVTLLGRGNYSMTDMRTYIEKLQSKASFTAWSRKSMKVGLCEVPPASQDASVLALFNTSSMSTLFRNILDQYLRLYQRKAHAHHYLKVSGFEVDHFVESQMSLEDIIESYQQMKQIKPLNIPRLRPVLYR